MTEMFSANELYLLFGFTVLLELYFFLMQRSTLEISRAADLDPGDGRRMLPLWYAVVWPTKLAKWGSAALIVIGIHWAPALIGLFASFLLTTFSPVPHRHFIRSFRRTVDKQIARGEDLTHLYQLKSMLEKAYVALDDSGPSI